METVRQACIMFFTIPTEVGIQKRAENLYLSNWIPACAGMV
jgi:hypothetical protein